MRGAPRVSRTWMLISSRSCFTSSTLTGLRSLMRSLKWQWLWLSTYSQLLTGMSIFAERINPNFIIMDATNQYFRRYGLDRLKLTTLALAEQHKCSLLKAKCVDFIARSPETLDAVLATEGYNHLVASCPLILTELLRAAHGRRNRGGSTILALAYAVLSLS